MSERYYSILWSLFFTLRRKQEKHEEPRFHVALSCFFPQKWAREVAAGFFSKNKRKSRWIWLWWRRHVIPFISFHPPQNNLDFSPVFQVPLGQSTLSFQPSKKPIDPCYPLDGLKKIKPNPYLLGRSNLKMYFHWRKRVILLEFILFFLVKGKYENKKISQKKSENLLN